LVVLSDSCVEILCTEELIAASLFYNHHTSEAA
jgi:hypothetical protein